MRDEKHDPIPPASAGGDPPRDDDEARRARFRTEFGTALSVQLARRRMTQSDLAHSVGRSPSYTNQVMSGRKGASPQWVELVADTLRLSKADRRRLHFAAAKDHGYRLDLTEPSSSRKRDE
jgi:cyanate lyase